MSNSQTTQSKLAKASYFNTLIFTIIAGIISVCLLALLFFQGMKQYLAFIITLEVGIFGIILICVIQILLNSKSQKTNKYILTWDKCPDYYTKRTSGTQDICSSDYLYTDAYGIQWIMKIYPDDDTTIPGGMRPLPLTADLTYNGGEPKYEKFPLTEISKENKLGTDAEKCGVLYNNPTSTSLSYLNGYNLVPWNIMTAKCDSIIQSSNN